MQSQPHLKRACMEGVTSNGGIVYTRSKHILLLKIIHNDDRMWPEGQRLLQL